MTNGSATFLAEWAAAERAGDTAKLRTILTDDFLGVGPVGFVLSKDAWLSRFANGLAYQSFELDELQPRLYGDSAVVTARALGRLRTVGRGTIGGRPLPFEAVRATLALVRRSDRWQIAGIHMSFIAGTPGAPAVPGAAPSAGGQQ
jgi:ketosteroid isomerase-like protein